MPNPGPVIASNSGKHALSSPIGTPIAVEKSKRRKQSLTEGTVTSPHTVSVHPELTCDPNLQTEYEHPTRTLCLEQFRLDATEQSVLRTLRVDLFHSILLRTFGSSKPLRLRPYYSSKPLRLRPYFFKPFRKHITPNTLYYVHTRPANPPGISGFIPEKRCLPAAPDIGQKLPDCRCVVRATPPPPRPHNYNLRARAHRAWYGAKVTRWKSPQKRVLLPDVL